MSQQPDKPIDPFQASRRASGIHVSIDVHDVQAVHPEVGEARARALLEIHKTVIARAMLIAARQVIRQLLEGEHAGGN